ncbi:neutral zinc metallopeptidase [Halpernia frigidisoli]|uniref:Metalloprotease n=1 Tax=Halpernia frigidisoli TaxID=1125876 RepID=A0A1I3HM43_9FLAO|nr:metalloprotease [Halpernia frigidisoli]SFI36816.1 hypothetical protein SAMN05443292_2288 [Halpernia frigidisoli]
MKQSFTKGIFAAAILSLTITSCTSENRDEIVSPEEVAVQANAENLNSDLLDCSYVDVNWASTAVLKTGLPLATDSNFMTGQMTKIAAYWKRTKPALSFVSDAANQNSTYNAISYSTGKIYYGYAIFADAKAKGGNIVNAMILAHEYGHQLQYAYSLPSVKENTARPNELEADGFAGYYLRRPTGYNQDTFAKIAAAYEFAQSIGDYQTTSAGHHGTPPQRRSAVRLGFLLAQYDLTAADFDYNFFYYYTGVLNETYRTAKNTRFPELDAYMSNYTEELKQIQTNEISAEEFKSLK